MSTTTHHRRRRIIPYWVVRKIGDGLGKFFVYCAKRDIENGDRHHANHNAAIIHVGNSDACQPGACTLDRMFIPGRVTFDEPAVDPRHAPTRLSHEQLDSLLAAWDHYDGDVDGFYDAWISHINDGVELPKWAR